MGDGGRQVSALRAVHSMLDRLYPSLTHSGREREQEEEDDDENEEEEEREETEGGVTLLTAAGCVVELVEPFVAHIHQQFASDKARSRHIPTLCKIVSSSASSVICRLLCRRSGLHCRESVWDCEYII